MYKNKVFIFFDIKEFSQLLLVHERLMYALLHTMIAMILSASEFEFIRITSGKAGLI